MPKVKIYSTPTCTYCILAKEWFKENNIEFEEVDVSQNEAEKNKLVEKTGQMAVPVIEVGEETFVAMCNASDNVKLAAARNTTRINCSKGPTDRAFNDRVFEIVTFEPDGSGGAPVSSSAPVEKQRVLRSSLSVTVVPK